MRTKFQSTPARGGRRSRLNAHPRSPRRKVSIHARTGRATLDIANTQAHVRRLKVSIHARTGRATTKVAKANRLRARRFNPRPARGGRHCRGAVEVLNFDGEFQSTPARGGRRQP